MDISNENYFKGVLFQAKLTLHLNRVSLIYWSYNHSITQL